MTQFYNRTYSEQETIRSAYDFEIEAIENEDSARNPYYDEIMTWPDGDMVWEAINEAVELAYM